MKGFFITGTDTGVGKTLFSAALLHALGGLGIRATGMKPVAAGAELKDGVWINEDVAMLAAASPIAVPPELANPWKSWAGWRTSWWWKASAVSGCL